MDLASLSASLWFPFWRNWRARLHSLVVMIGDEEEAFLRVILSFFFQMILAVKRESGLCFN